MLAKLGRNAVATSPKGEDLIRRKTIVVNFRLEQVCDSWLIAKSNSVSYQTNQELVILLIKSIFRSSNIEISMRKTTCLKQVENRVFLSPDIQKYKIYTN